MYDTIATPIILQIIIDQNLLLDEVVLTIKPIHQIGMSQKRYKGHFQKNNTTFLISSNLAIGTYMLYRIN